MTTPTLALTETLRQARKTQRLSQLELSMRMGVSQRHVSCVESGRARASRELLMRWLQALEVPLPVRNAAMLQAGYAPVYSAATLDDPSLAQARQALVTLLEAHDPMPAFVIDAQWNVLHANRSGAWLAATLAPGLADLSVDAPHLPPPNMLDLLTHPDGFCRHVTNLPEVGPTLLAHLRNETASEPALRPKVEAFAAMLRARLGAQSPYGWPHQAAPVLTTRFATAHGELAFFSMFTTFGTPQDITLASLRVEHMFAADEGTRAVLSAEAR